MGSYHACLKTLGGVSDMSIICRKCRLYHLWLKNKYLLARIIEEQREYIQDLWLRKGAVFRLSLKIHDVWDELFLLPKMILSHLYHT